MKISFRYKIIFGNAIGFLVLAFVFFQGYKTINQFQNDTNWVNHTYQVLEKNQEIFSLSIQLQNAARGFTLTSDSTFKERIAISTATIYSEIGFLRNLTSDNISQQKNIDTLNVLIGQRVEHSNNLVSLVDKGEQKKAVDSVQSGNGDLIAQKTIDLIKRMQDEETRLLAIREKDSEQSEANFYLMAGLAIVLVLLLFAIMFWMVLKSHKKAGNFQKKLEQREIFLNDIINYNNDFIYVKDLQGRYLLINSSIEKMLNLKKEDLVGKTDHELFPKEMADEYRQADLQVIASKEILQLEEKMKLRDGLHYFETTKFPMYNETGRLYAIGSTSSDITERRKNLIEIKKLTERVQLATNGAKIGIWDWDIKKNELLWDKKMYELYGIKEKDFENAFKAWQKGIHPDDKVHDNEEIQKALKGEKKFDTEIRVIWPDESMHYLTSFAEVIRNEQGEPVRMVGVNWDITNEKNYQQQIEESKAQLEAVNKELESFSYSVSHDLRAPLRSITGYSQIVMEDYQDKLDDEGKRLLNIIKDNTDKMGKLIDGLLAFSRLGRKEVSKKDIDNTKLVNEIIEGVKHRNPDRKIKWQVKDLPTAKGDYEMIKQVWENYIINAVKYSRKKEMAEIEIGGTKKDKEIIFYVKDNGAGFDMKYYDKIFAVFQRLHGHDEFEGTGVGLANVQKIVTKHGGRVWAEGEEDKGACFYFSLPVKIQGFNNKFILNEE